jgi:RHS repeat-associated protein
MARLSRCILYISILSFSALMPYLCFAQATPSPNQGLWPFDSVNGGQYDTINLATLGIQVRAPFRSKQASPSLPFSYAAGASDYVGAEPGVDGGPTGSFGSPGLGMSFSSISALVPKGCVVIVDGLAIYGEYTHYSAFYATDILGNSHPFVIVVNSFCHGLPGAKNSPPNSGSAYSGDGSGYYMSVTCTDSCPATLYDPSGRYVTTYGAVEAGGGNIETDPDGNSQKNSLVDTGSPETNTYTDSLGLTAMTATLNLPAAPPFTWNLAWNNATGQSQASITFSGLYIGRAGGTACGNYNLNITGLYSSITGMTFADGSLLSIGYEQASGTNPNGGPCYTGRFSSLSLPTGANITYTYGPYNSDGTPSTMTRTTPEGTWTYVHTVVSTSSSSTAVTDPAGNETDYTFSGTFTTYLNRGYETLRKFYAGSAASGTLLETVQKCYNNNFNSCSAPSTPITFPFSQTDVYTAFNTSSSNLVETKFDTYGNTIEVKQYDFGAAMPPTGNPLSDTLTYYGQSWNGTSCTAYPSGIYIVNTPCYSYTKNSAGATVAQKQITYSNAGHPTTTKRLTTGTASLTATATYNSNGTIATATDVNGALFTYAYDGTDGCSSLLPTSVTVTGTGLPSGGLTNSTEWNCNGGVVTQTSDSSSQTTSYAYNDPLWRITSITDPLGNETAYKYLSPTTFESVMNYGTVSTTDTLITTDGLGRQIFSQTRQGQGSSMFDTVQTTYGWSTTGPFTTTSIPYFGTQAETTPSGTGSTTTQDDAVSRPISVSNTAGGLVSTTYAQNDVLSVLGPAPAGEHTKQTQTQYDGLGRVTSVCGIESSGGTGCGQVTGTLSGVVTTTAYTSAAGSQTVTSTRGSQSRSRVVDGLGRITQVVTPEGGTWTYTYDQNTSCPSGWQGVSGQLASVKDPNLYLLCYSYDSLNRITGVNANNGTTSTCSWFYYDNSTGYTGTVPTGVTLANQYGRMVEAATDGCTAVTSHTSATLTTDEWFAYDKDGRLLNSWELTPNSTQYYKAEMTYTGPSLTGVNFVSPSLSAFTYDLDGEGRWNKMLVGSATDVAGVTYNAAGQPTNISIGSGTDYDGYAYDSNTMNMTGWTFQVNSVRETATITPNPNNTIKSVAITDGFNANGTITCSYNIGLVTGTGYDDLGRLIGHSCTGTGGTWSQTFAYDQYDNITKTGSGLPSWNPGYSATTNHYTCTGCTTDSNGNVTNDGNNAYTWNAFSKMASVNMSGSGCSTSGDCIVYDAFGRAVEFDNGSTKTEIWYSPIGKHYLNGTTPLYGYEAAPGGGTIFGSTYMHKDWIGNARVISSITASTITTDRAFAPFGEVFNIFGGTGQSDIMFAGLDQGIFAGMYDTPNRELQGSQQGRWLSPDPASQGSFDPSNPQNWNRYAYVLNNPLGNVDPLGLDCVYLGDDGTVTHIGLDDCDPKIDNAFYFDGTVDPNSVQVNPNGDVIANVDGNTQCSGNSCNSPTVSATASDQQGSLLQLLTTTVPIYVPNDVPLSHSGQAAAAAISRAIANVPNVCAAGVSASVTVLKTNLSASGSLSPSGVGGQVSGQLPFGQTHTVGSAESQAQGTPLIPTPSYSPVNVPVNAQMNGRRVLSVNADFTISVAKQSVSLTPWANLSGFGDPNCP